MLPLERKFADNIKMLNVKANMPVAVACSGGPDSMALALMAQSWAKAGKSKVVALIVDHGLRRESAKEAKQVGAWLKKQGIAHAILTWNGRKPVRNVQEAARKARYRLLSDYCKTHKIEGLLVAHHLEDQAETFLLRLARGSGVDGLAGMSALTGLYDVTLIRPLLGVPKAELLAYLAKRKQPFINDPGNENPAFDRVRMRKMLPALAEVGITPERLAKTATNMARARAHLEEETGKFLKSACTLFSEGYASLKHVKISEEIGLRALATLIMIIGGNEVKTRLADLERLYAAVKDTGFRGATLGGCVFTRHKDAILIYRELKSVAPPRTLKAGAGLMWDNRFEMTLKSASMRLRVGALTQSGWLALAKTHTLKNPCPNKNILYALPALRDSKGKIIAVPHLKYYTQDVKCDVVFKAVPVPADK
jgi:tRNA(Ile)-lysidine synthase